MTKARYNLDEMLESAIREKGAKEFLQRIEARDRRRQRRRRTFVYSFAACLAILLVGGWRFSYNTRVAGYAFDPVAGQMGGSEITALMQKRQIKEALIKIDEAREILAEEMANPSSDDPEYRIQLETDRQELDFLSAVCAMRQGRYFKAKRALKEIAAGGGTFAEEARTLLETF